MFVRFETVRALISLSGPATRALLLGVFMASAVLMPKLTLAGQQGSSGPGLVKPENTTLSTLFRVDRHDLSPSYLLGTMHVSDPKVTAFPAEIHEVINKTDRLIVEASVDAEAKRLITQTMMLPAGERLSDHVSDGLLASIKHHLRNTPQVIVDHILRMKPWAVMTHLSLPSDLSGPNMDRLIENKYLQAEKPVGQIETVAEQLSVFDNLSMAEQVALLQDAVDLIPYKDRILERMYTLYLSGDLVGLRDVSKNYRGSAAGEAFESLMVALLDSRNERMARRLSRYLDLGNVLISIGALHLPGNSGLIALLEQSGFKVTPIELSR